VWNKYKIPFNFFLKYVKKIKYLLLELHHENFEWNKYEIPFNVVITYVT